MLGAKLETVALNGDVIALDKDICVPLLAISEAVKALVNDVNVDVCATVIGKTGAVPEKFIEEGCGPETLVPSLPRSQHRCRCIVCPSR